MNCFGFRYTAASRLNESQQSHELPFVSYSRLAAQFERLKVVLCHHSIWWIKCYVVFIIESFNIKMVPYLRLKQSTRNIHPTSGLLLSSTSRVEDPFSALLIISLPFFFFSFFVLFFFSLSLSLVSPSRFKYVVPTRFLGPRGTVSESGGLGEYTANSTFY